MSLDYPKFIVLNQKEEVINIQRVKHKHTYMEQVILQSDEVCLRKR